MSNIIIIGHGRHGKDTVAEILRDDFGLSFQSSSQACSDIFIFETLRVKYGYNTPEECFADRHNHRAEWATMITDFNTPDPTKLCEIIFKDYDIYVGMRSMRELTQYMHDENTHVLWVDASDRLPLESRESMNIEEWMADTVIDNNGPEKELRAKVINWAWEYLGLSND